VATQEFKSLLPNEILGTLPQESINENTDTIFGLSTQELQMSQIQYNNKY